MLTDEQLQIGKVFKGKVNGAVFEIVDVKQDYIKIRDAKTKKIFHHAKSYFRNLLIEEVER